MNGEKTCEVKQESVLSKHYNDILGINERLYSVRSRLNNKLVSLRGENPEKVCPPQEPNQVLCGFLDFLKDDTLKANRILDEIASSLNELENLI